MESHPVWVRGLKLDHREPCVKCYRVAPCVGAWIETACRISTCKLEICRTLCGCVD